MKILIAIDQELEIDSDGIIQFLKNKTNHLEFDLYSKNIEFKSSDISKPSSFEEIESQFESYLKTYSHVFCFTEKPYDDNYFFHEHHNISIFTFYGWSSLTSLPKTNGLIYFILDYLALDLDTSDFRHHEETGCIYDFLWNKDGIDDGMRQARICPNCLDRITKSLNKEDQFSTLADIKVLMNSLSNSSKWNQNVLDELQNNKKIISTRQSKKPGEINIVIASPGDTHQERKVLLDALEIQFRKGNHEAHCKHRLIVHGWEDLASQNGYPQDVINQKIIQEMDFVVSLFKHKLGTPTINLTTGNVRAESGTVEELLQALDYSNNGHPLGMAYFYSKAPVISLDSPDFTKMKEEWERLEKFKQSIKNKMIYKPYTDGGELLTMYSGPHK
jgi:hypothetical protein